jgi:hypothetical protein
MSNDLETDLRDLLAAKSKEVRAFPVAPPNVLRRARRGEVRTVAAAAIVGALRPWDEAPRREWLCGTSH